MVREMTDKEKKEYDRITANAEQMTLQLEELTSDSDVTVYGYIRVGAYGYDGNTLEEQKRNLIAAGAENIYVDVSARKVADQPKLHKLVDQLERVDTLIVTNLNQLGKSVSQTSRLILTLLDAGVTINILDVGILRNNSVPTIMYNMLLCFTKYGRDMIVERTKDGRALARRKPGYREGRPKKYTKAQMEYALFLLGEFSYKQVVEMTGISRATLAREKRKRDKQAIW